MDLSADGHECEALAVLGDDVWLHVFAFLPGAMLGAVASSCRYFHGLCDNQLLWKTVTRRGQHGTGLPLVARHDGEGGGGGEHWRDVFRQVHAMATLKKVEWVAANLHHSPGADPLPQLEGTAAAAWGSYLLIFGGFSHGGIITQLSVINTETMRTVPSECTGQEPMPAYGHTLTYVGDDKLILYGGCLHGSYRGSCAQTFLVSLTLKESPECVCAHFHELHDGGLDVACPASSIGGVGYHHAAALPADISKVVFFGGIARGGALSDVAVFDSGTATWTRPAVAQEVVAAPQAAAAEKSDQPASQRFAHLGYRVVPAEPRGRYGAAVAIIDNKLWVCGGTTGCDLRRGDGRDCRDVFFADLSQLLTQNTIAWYQVPDCEFISKAASPGSRATTYALGGREMASAPFGHKIVMFGGSTNSMQCDESTDAVYWFDTKSGKFGHPRITGPGGAIPHSCISAEATIIGQKMYLYGGWCRRGLLAGPFVLDLNSCEDGEEGEEHELHIAPGEGEQRPELGRDEVLRYFLQMLQNGGDMLGPDDDDDEDFDDDEDDGGFYFPF